jgi:ABC-2 type transport system permease protein
MNSGTNALAAVFAREFRSYFATPLAFVFIVIFLFAMGAFTFYLGHFYDNGVADLTVFFGYHPWLYLFLVPALAMRLWAEERRSGTMELLLTLPVPLWATVLGKFLAAWAFAGLALLLTFPIWITVNYLGHPDNGVILTSYVGSFLMAGAYLSIGACVSAATSNQVIAFIVSVVVCFLLTIAGAPLVLDAFRAWAPLPLVEAISSFSFITHFASITQGVIDLRDLVFFFSLIGLFLYANMLIVDLRQSG